MILPVCLSDSLLVSHSFLPSFIYLFIYLFIHSFTDWVRQLLASPSSVSQTFSQFARQLIFWLLLNSARQQLNQSLQSMESGTVLCMVCAGVRTRLWIWATYPPQQWSSCSTMRHGPLSCALYTVWSTGHLANCCRRFSSWMMPVPEVRILYIEQWYVGHW